MPDASLLDRWLSGLRNNPVVATVILIALIVGGLATFGENALKLWHMAIDTPAKASYRKLDADLDALEHQLNAMVQSDGSLAVVAEYLPLIQLSVTRVCDARDTVSQLGDIAVREQLNKLCSGNEFYKTFANPTSSLGGPNATFALASAELVVLADLRKAVSSKL